MVAANRVIAKQNVSDFPRSYTSTRLTTTRKDGSFGRTVVDSCRRNPILEGRVVATEIRKTSYDGFADGSTTKRTAPVIGRRTRTGKSSATTVGFCEFRRWPSRTFAKSAGVTRNTHPPPAPGRLLLSCTTSGVGVVVEYIGTTGKDARRNRDVR